MRIEISYSHLFDSPCMILWNNGEIIATMYAERFATLTEDYIHLVGFTKNHDAVGHFGISKISVK